MEVYRSEIIELSQHGEDANRTEAFYRTAIAKGRTYSAMFPTDDVIHAEWWRE